MGGKKFPQLFRRVQQLVVPRRQLFFEHFKPLAELSRPVAAAEAFHQPRALLPGEKAHAPGKLPSPAEARHGRGLRHGLAHGRIFPAKKRVHERTLAALALAHDHHGEGLIGHEMPKVPEGPGRFHVAVLKHGHFEGLGALRGIFEARSYDHVPAGGREQRKHALHVELSQIARRALVLTDRLIRRGRRHVGACRARAGQHGRERRHLPSERRRKEGFRLRSALRHAPFHDDAVLIRLVALGAEQALPCGHARQKTHGAAQTFHDAATPRHVLRKRAAAHRGKGGRKLLHGRNEGFRPLLRQRGEILGKTAVGLELLGRERLLQKRRVKTRLKLEETMVRLLRKRVRLRGKHGNKGVRSLFPGLGRKTPAFLSRRGKKHDEAVFRRKLRSFGTGKFGHDAQGRCAHAPIVVKILFHGRRLPSLRGPFREVPPW